MQSGCVSSPTQNGWHDPKPSPSTPKHIDVPSQLSSPEYGLTSTVQASPGASGLGAIGEQRVALKTSPPSFAHGVHFSPASQSCSQTLHGGPSRSGMSTLNPLLSTPTSELSLPASLVSLDDGPLLADVVVTVVGFGAVGELPDEVAVGPPDVAGPDGVPGVLWDSVSASEVWPSAVSTSTEMAGPQPQAKATSSESDGFVGQRTTGARTTILDCTNARQLIELIGRPRDHRPPAARSGWAAR